MAADHVVVGDLDIVKLSESAGCKTDTEPIPPV